MVMLLMFQEALEAEPSRELASVCVLVKRAHRPEHLEVIFDVLRRFVEKKLRTGYGSSGMVGWYDACTHGQW